MDDTTSSQDTTSNEGSEDFASSLELEPEATTETTEQPEETTEPAEVTKEAETTETETAPENTPNEEAPEEQEEKTDLKGMTREERAEFFKAQQAEKQREIQAAVDASYTPQDVTELQDYYMQQGYDEGTSLMLARQDVNDQKQQINEAKTEIIELNSNLQNSSVEARYKYDWMNPDKPETYDKELHELTANLFSKVITTDPRTGQVIDAQMSPMQMAELVDKIRNSGVSKAQLKAQKAAEQQLASVAPPTSSVPSQGTKTPEDKQVDDLNNAFNVI